MTRTPRAAAFTNSSVMTSSGMKYGFVMAIDFLAELIERRNSM